MDSKGKGVSLVTLDVVTSASGFSYLASLPVGSPPGDSPAAPTASGLKLFEDGVPLGPAHSQHAHISEFGGGRFSHWGGSLLFSSSDNSDPRANGRCYQALLVSAGPESPVRRAAALLENLPAHYTSAEAYGAAESALMQIYPTAWIGEDQKSFWREARLVEAYQRLCGANRRSYERKFALVNLLKLSLRTDGDVGECGVFEGATAWFMADSLREANAERPIHLFDSFEGLSNPASVDGDFWRRGSLAAPEAAARRNLSEFQNVRFYKGWIPARFSEVSDRSFSFVHIDVDLHQPTLECLEFFFPRLTKGGLIVCDDYGFDTCPGARKAVDEFFADKREPIVHLPTGQAFIIKA